MFIKKKLNISIVCWLKQHRGWLVILTLAVTLFLLPASASGQNESGLMHYTVKPGDHLIKIAKNFGSAVFWKPIFEANRDKVENPDLIHPGQQLVIPSSIRKSKKFAYINKEITAAQPHRDRSEAPVDNKDEEDQELLEKFREAFEQVANTKQATQKDPKPAPPNGLEFGGLVINQTKSKMGNDFYNVFYKYWEPPESAQNFMITISEQPVPSLGALVTVKIDNQQVYQAKLQPRFAIIENHAKRAVMVSYQSLNQQLSTSSQIPTY